MSKQTKERAFQVIVFLPFLGDFFHLLFKHFILRCVAFLGLLFYIIDFDISLDFRFITLEVWAL